MVILVANEAFLIVDILNYHFVIFNTYEALIHRRLNLNTVIERQISGRRAMMEFDVRAPNYGPVIGLFFSLIGI